VEKHEQIRSGHELIYERRSSGWGDL